ncbi:MAG TPA: PEGA domain-containing protein [Candidatus Eisenbacteria bacterium]|nr:PEGA domain-containing protein [Candidatus Eisenbacteria bacterium]
MTLASLLLGAAIALHGAPDFLAAVVQPDDPAAMSAEKAIERARELVGDADYDRSIEVLRVALTRPALTLDQKRDIYLLLIKTYVFLGNDLKFKPQGREASNLNYREARHLIAEMLRVRELRHTQPEANSPPEMIAFFSEVRRQIFGAFRVLETTPRTAFVLLDGDTLRAQEDGKRGDIDIETGPHRVVVDAEGFKRIEERITIAPNVTLEKSYHLDRRHGPWYYASRWIGGIGLASGIAILASQGGDDGGGETLEPLPGAPPPPARANR